MSAGAISGLVADGLATPLALIRKHVGIAEVVIGTSENAVTWGNTPLLDFHADGTRLHSDQRYRIG